MAVKLSRTSAERLELGAYQLQTLNLDQVSCIVNKVLCLTDLFISITLHLVGLSMIIANADPPPSHLCDGLIDCQNGRRASIGNRKQSGYNFIGAHGVL